MSLRGPFQGEDGEGFQAASAFPGGIEAADARRSAGGSPLPDEPPAPITRGASSSVGSTFSGKL